MTSSAREVVSVWGPNSPSPSNLSRTLFVQQKIKWSQDQCTTSAPKKPSSSLVANKCKQCCKRLWTHTPLGQIGRKLDSTKRLHYWGKAIMILYNSQLFYVSARVRAHTHTHARTHSLTHTHEHTHTNTHTHTHTHARARAHQTKQSRKQTGKSSDKSKWNLKKAGVKKEREKLKKEKRNENEKTKTKEKRKKVERPEDMMSEGMCSVIPSQWFTGNYTFQQVLSGQPSVKNGYLHSVNTVVVSFQ